MQRLLPGWPGWQVREHGVLVRYADDVLVMCKSRGSERAGAAAVLLASWGWTKAAKTASCLAKAKKASISWAFTSAGARAARNRHT